MRIVTLVPFIPEVPPTWVPPNCALAQDGGSGATADLLRAQAGLRFHSHENLGYTKTVNATIKSLREWDVVLVWNSDARLWGEPEDFLPFFDDPSCALVAPSREIQPHDSPIGTDEPIKGDIVLAEVVVTEHGPMVMTASRNAGLIKICGMGYAPLFAVRREAFLAVGGFDEVFSPGFYEDADLCRRLRLFGWKTYATTQITYTHGDDIGATKSFEVKYGKEGKDKLGIRNLRILLTKWGIMPPLARPLHSIATSAATACDVSVEG